MMRTEQKCWALSGQKSTGRWLFLSLLALTVPWATLPGFGAALASEAEVEIVEEAEVDTQADDDTVADKGSDDGSSADEQKKKEEAEPASEDQEEAKDEDEKKQETPDETPEEEEAKEMKTDGDENQNKETKPAVESERELEVEPPPIESIAQPPVTPKQPKKKKCIIGATATLLEKQSELKFRARVDSGAKSCSLHVEKIKIQEESKKEDITERMTENIGKVIHFEVKNGNNKTHILTSKIAGYVIIKTSDKKEGKRRYKVQLTFRWKSMEKEVLVTLNNRNHMEYPLLLGRNFLKNDFLVDVSLDSDD